MQPCFQWICPQNNCLKHNKWVVLKSVSLGSGDMQFRYSSKISQLHYSKQQMRDKKMKRKEERSRTWTAAAGGNSFSRLLYVGRHATECDWAQSVIRDWYWATQTCDATDWGNNTSSSAPKRHFTMNGKKEGRKETKGVHGYGNHSVRLVRFRRTVCAQIFERVLTKWFC